MTLNPNDIIMRPRHSVREQKLARDIRELPEEQRIELIRELIQKDLIVGLMFANACVRKKEFFEELLEEGLRTANASSIKDWLKCIVPRLGFCPVIARLKNKLDSDPDSAIAVDKARYQLAGLLPKHDPRAVAAWKDLDSVMRKRGLVVEAKRTGLY